MASYLVMANLKSKRVANFRSFQCTAIKNVILRGPRMAFSSDDVCEGVYYYIIVLNDEASVNNNKNKMIREGSSSIIFTYYLNHLCLL